jgi:hypothetical protein
MTKIFPMIANVTRSHSTTLIEIKNSMLVSSLVKFAPLIMVGGKF